MSLLNNFLKNSKSSVPQQQLGNNLAFQNFLKKLNTNNPKQSVMDLLKQNNYSQEQIAHVKQMAKQFGFSDAQISQIDNLIS